ncbi:MAG: hypothetical protein WCA31_13250 [Acidimicrobiales bacterium]
MASELIMEFDGVGDNEYFAVNKELGIDAASGDGDWPEGMLFHSAGLNADGRFVVTEVWESLEDQESFMKNRLASALEKGGITEPPFSVTWIDLVAHHNLSD